MPNLDDPQVQAVLQTIVLAVLSALGAVITTAITLGTRKALKWLDGKAHAATFQCAIEKISTVTKSAVDEVEQTLVRQLKADDKWDADTAREARDTAVDTAARHLGERGMKELQGCLGQAKATIMGMLRTYVEKHVRGMGSTNGKSPVVPMGESE